MPIDPAGFGGSRARRSDPADHGGSRRAQGWRRSWQIWRSALDAAITGSKLRIRDCPCIRKTPLKRKLEFRRNATFQVLNWTCQPGSIVSRVYSITGSKRLDETNRRRIIVMAFRQVNAEFLREALQRNDRKHLQPDDMERNQETGGMRLLWRNRDPFWVKAIIGTKSIVNAIRRVSPCGGLFGTGARTLTAATSTLLVFGLPRPGGRHVPSRDSLGAGAGRLPAHSRCHAPARSDRDGARRGEWQRHPRGIRVGGEGTVQEPRLGNRVSGTACVRGMPASARGRPVPFRFHLHRDADT